MQESVQNKLRTGLKLNESKYANGMDIKVRIIWVWLSMTSIPSVIFAALARRVSLCMQKQLRNDCLLILLSLFIVLGNTLIPEIGSYRQMVIFSTFGD